MSALEIAAGDHRIHPRRGRSPEPLSQRELADSHISKSAIGTPLPEAEELSRQSGLANVLTCLVAGPLAALALGLAAAQPALAAAAAGAAQPAVALDAATLGRLEKLNDDSDWVGLEHLAGPLAAG